MSGTLVRELSKIYPKCIQNHALSEWVPHLVSNKLNSR